jgi:hypothetical protein
MDDSHPRSVGFVFLVAAISPPSPSHSVSRTLLLHSTSHQVSNDLTNSIHVCRPLHLHHLILIFFKTSATGFPLDIVHLPSVVNFL